MAHLGELDRRPLVLGDFAVGIPLEAHGDDVAQGGVEREQAFDDGRDYRNGQQAAQGIIRRHRRPGSIVRHGRTGVAASGQLGIFLNERDGKERILPEIAFRARGFFPGLGIILTAFDGSEVGA